VTLLLLVRHGTTDLTGKRLYGRTPGVHLSEDGRRQAEAVARRLMPVRPTALYTSPIDRCTETAAAIGEACGLEAVRVPDLAEIDYGRFTGRSFASLARTRLWRRLHRIPSGVRFPEGETLNEAQARMVSALEAIVGRHPRGRVAVVSHGDPICMALAHYAGLHIDLFMRLQVFPGSVSTVGVEDAGPKVLAVNDTGSLAHFGPSRR
jgi:probable phosphomutase (TIGR03848 family)